MPTVWIQQHTTAGKPVTYSIHLGDPQIPGTYRVELPEAVLDSGRALDRTYRALQEILSGYYRDAVIDAALEEML